MDDINHMESAMARPDAISKEELKQLSAPSAARAWLGVAVNFGLVAAAFALPALWNFPMAWLAWLLAAIVLAGRAQGLGVLAHDACHLAYFPSRRLNLWAGKWLFAALPHLAFERYRQGHLEHHRQAGTERDPDRGFVATYPASRASLARKLARDLSGLNGMKNIMYQLRGVDRESGVPFLLAHALLFGALWLAGAPQVYACWWLGQVFVFPLLVRLRVMSEHGAVPDALSRDPRLSVGTTLSGPLARLLVTPNHVNYHVEHHLAAGVPSYRLPAMHRLLVQRGYYNGAQCLAPSLWAVVQRCSAAPGTTKRTATPVKARNIFENMR